LRTPEESLTVSELNNFIRDVLNSGFPAAVWICGEVQELRDKKHLYFTLSEKDPESNAIVAKIGVTIWANTRPRIEAILKKAENSFALKDDIEVKLLCKVDFYPPFGQVRLVVEGIDPTYTLGKIAQDRQRLILALKQKGILDKNKQIEMPRLPLFIGLITSYDSAAYHDFVHELKKSRYTFHVRLVDCLMQGKNSEVSVSKAIKFLNQREDIDVIVITRGGGSITELSCFDSQMIAEAVAASRLPVLSGIGHEINTTITDLAAHTFAKTPTATAQYIVGRVQEFLSHLQEKQEFLLNLLERTLDERRQYVKHQAMTLRQSTMGLIHTQQNMLSRMTETFKRLPVSLVKESKKQSLQWVVDLKKTIHLRLQTSKTKIQSYQKLVDVADPKNTLKRGFSITRDSKGKVIKSVKNLQLNHMTTQVADGIIKSNVVEISEG
jgi:exodeoxyribonuclease VII large subunit